jgi:carbonic anhydrase
VRRDQAAAASQNHPVKHWGYRNEDRSLLPKDWHKNHQKCYGSKQSPINVESRTTAYDSTLTQLNINQVRSSGENENGEDKEKWEIKNNGHSSKYESSLTFFYDQFCHFCMPAFRYGCMF